MVGLEKRTGWKDGERIRKREDEVVCLFVFLMRTMRSVTQRRRKQTLYDSLVDVLRIFKMLGSRKGYEDERE